MVAIKFNGKETDTDICHYSMQHAALIFPTFLLSTGSVSYSLVFFHFLLIFRPIHLQFLVIRLLLLRFLSFLCFFLFCFVLIFLLFFLFFKLLVLVLHLCIITFLLQTFSFFVIGLNLFHSSFSFFFLLLIILRSSLLFILLIIQASCSYSSLYYYLSSSNAFIFHINGFSSPC